MNKQIVNSKTKSLRSMEHCRAADIGIGNFAECLKAGPAACSYALPFGYCFLCMHPRVADIIENTKKQAMKEALKM